MGMWRGVCGRVRVAGYVVAGYVVAGYVAGYVAGAGYNSVVMPT